MPSLADVIEQSRTGQAHVSSAGDSMPLGNVSTPDDIPESLRPASRSYTNKDLIPAARRVAAGIGDEAAASPQDFGRGGHVATPNGPAYSERDRLLDEAKGTLKRVDPFAKMLEGAGNAAAGEALQPHQGPGEAAVRSLGDTAVGVAKGATHIPGDLLGGVLGLPGTILAGYESLPEGVKAVIDPATWHGMPDAAKQGLTELGNDPETATRLFGGMLAAGPASDLAGAGLARAPGLAGRAISGVGKGISAIGDSSLVKNSGLLRKGAAVLHPGLGTAAAAVGPEMLGGLGRGIQRAGAAVSDLPNSPALEALRRIGNKDVGAAIKAPFEHVPTADELAAGSVRSTVGTARDLMDKGQSRAQAAQRAGWPLGQSTGEPRFTPGADVEANRPYAPAVRGKAGNIIQEGRRQVAPSLSALDDLAGPSGRHNQPLDNVAVPEAMQGGEDFLAGAGTQARAPYYAGDIMNEKYMTDQAAQNGPIARASQEASNTAESSRLMDALRAHQGQADAEFDRNLTGPEVDLSNLSPLDRLSRLSRARARTRSLGTNSPLAEGF